MNNDKKNNNVDDIFARQIAALELDEEEEAIAKKLGLDADDLDLTDIFDEYTFDKLNDWEEDSLPIDEIPLMLADDFNKTTDPNEMKSIIAQGINSVVSAIESDRINHKSIDRNEKLLLITENHNLYNAVTYLGFQMIETFEDGMSPIGTTGEYLKYVANLVNMLNQWNEYDANTQTTLACEMDLIESEQLIVLDMAIKMNKILQRIDAIQQRKEEWPDEIDLPDICDQTFEVVKEYYTSMQSIFLEVNEDLKAFLNDYHNGKIVLNESGGYNPYVSVRKMAKAATFNVDVFPVLSDEAIESIVLEFDAEENMQDFLKNQRYKANKSERNSLAKVLFNCLNSRRLRGDELFDCCEKLLLVDQEHHYTHVIEKYKKEYAKNASDKNYQGYIGSKAQTVITKRASEQRYRERLPHGTTLVAGIACVVLAVLSLLFPMSLLEVIFEGFMKIVYAFVTIVLLFSAGPVGLLMLPVFIFGVQFVLGIVDAFINPLLAIKIIFALIFGGIAYALIGDKSYALKNLKAVKEALKQAKEESLPLAQDILARAKKANLSSEIVSYYENMLNDINGIK